LENIPDRIRQAVYEERPIPRDWMVEAQQILNRAGYAVPHWPLEWGGRDWSPLKRAILAQEIDRNSVPKPLPFNVALIGPIIAAFGSEEQKRRFLPAIANLDQRRIGPCIAQDVGSAGWRALSRQWPQDLDDLCP
jgi:alkylation response protein AidB-like acyl-CoA dehydrogenase